METNQSLPNQNLTEPEIYPKQTSPNKKLFAVVIGVLLTSVIIGLAVYFWQDFVGKKSIDSLEQKIISSEGKTSAIDKTKANPKKSPSLELSPEPTSYATDWETYTNEYWKFSFKYPAQQFVICPDYTTEQEGVRLWEKGFSCPSGTDAFYQIGVLGYLPKDYKEYKPAASTQDIMVNGLSATKKVYVYDETDGPLMSLGESTEIIISMNDKVIKFQLLKNDKESNEYLNQILSTFKFID